MKLKGRLRILAVTLVVLAVAIQIWAYLAGQFLQLANVIASVVAGAGALSSEGASLFVDNPVFSVHERRPFTTEVDLLHEVLEQAPREQFAEDGKRNKAATLGIRRRLLGPESPAQELFCAWDDDATRADSRTRRPEWETTDRYGRRFLYVKWGVAHIHVARSHAKVCIAKANARITKSSGASGFEPSRESGWVQLNWWNESIRKELPHDVHARNAIFEDPGRGVDIYLEHPSESISPSAPKDLPLFYMRLGHPAVFLGGTPGPTILGSPGTAEPLEFDLDLCLEAENGSPQIFRFHVTAKWDVFTFEQTWGRRFVEPNGPQTARQRVRALMNMSREDRVKFVKRWREGPPPFPPGA